MSQREVDNIAGRLATEDKSMADYLQFEKRYSM